MTETHETLDMLLDKLEAFFDCEAAKPKELAEYLGCYVQRIYEWVMNRTAVPPGNIALQMQAWAAKINIRIAAVSELQSAYRASYKEIAARPVKGKD